MVPTAEHIAGPITIATNATVESFSTILVRLFILFLIVIIGLAYFQSINPTSIAGLMLGITALTAITSRPFRRVPASSICRWFHTNRLRLYGLHGLGDKNP